MKREVKFKYIYSDGTNTIARVFTLEEIVNGAPFEALSDSPLLKHYRHTGEYQYTGLKDKYGNEIYEGDIVKYPNMLKVVKYRNFRATTDEEKESCYTLGEVVVSDGCTWFRKNGSMSCIAWLMTPNGYPSIPTLTSANFEIIGNIYENTELLEL